MCRRSAFSMIPFRQGWRLFVSTEDCSIFCGASSVFLSIFLPSLFHFLLFCSSFRENGRFWRSFLQFGPFSSFFIFLTLCHYRKSVFWSSVFCLFPEFFSFSFSFLFTFFWLKLDGNRFSGRIAEFVLIFWSEFGIISIESRQTTFFLLSPRRPFCQ